MTTLNEFPLIKLKKDTCIDKDSYSHPSFGTIDIAKRGGSKSTLFDAQAAETTFSISIKESQISYGLGRTWTMGRTNVINVEMSEFQFSEFIMTDGAVVPCTIRFSEKDGRVDFKPHQTSDADIQFAVSGIPEFASEISRLEEELKTLIFKKGTLKKAEKEAIVSLTKELKDFVDKNADKMKNKALNHIDAIQQETADKIQSHLDDAVEKALFTVSSIDTKRLT